VSTARVDFTRGAAERIARVVRLVEQGDRGQSGPTWDNVDSSSGSGGKVFRICTFTGSWNIDTLKTVTFRNVTTTPNTVAAVNLFATLTGPSGTVSTAVCAIAKEGSAWYLIQARC
jgi:hypothetical protein